VFEKSKEENCERGEERETPLQSPLQSQASNHEEDEVPIDSPSHASRQIAEAWLKLARSNIRHEMSVFASEEFEQKTILAVDPQTSRDFTPVHNDNGVPHDGEQENFGYWDDEDEFVDVYEGHAAAGYSTDENDLVDYEAEFVDASGIGYDDDGNDGGDDDNDTLREEDYEDWGILGELYNSWVNRGDHAEDGEIERFDDPLSADPFLVEGENSGDPFSNEIVSPEQGTPRNPNSVPLVRAVADYSSEESSDLRFHEGDVLAVLHKGESGWWQGHVVNGSTSTSQLQSSEGWFPCTFVEWIPEESPGDDSALG
jgi:hypothetical protein